MTENHSKPKTDATLTPMSDHIARFWHALETEHVRIVVNMRRPHDDPNSGVMYHWDGAVFPNDVAKALVAERGIPAQSTPSEGYRPDLETVAGLRGLVRLDTIIELLNSAADDLKTQPVTATQALQDLAGLLTKRRPSHSQEANAKHVDGATR